MRNLNIQARLCSRADLSGRKSQRQVFSRQGPNSTNTRNVTVLKLGLLFFYCSQQQKL